MCLSNFLRLAILAMSIGASTTHAATITTMIGDLDHLGGSISPGDISFLGPFDNQSAAELAATNGAQYTDYATSEFGTWFGNPEFVFNYTPGAVSSAVLTVGFSGVQTMNDRLHLDNTLISSVFPEQGPNGYDDSYSLTIGSTYLGLLADGAATFRFNSNIRGEPVVFD